MKMGFNAEHQVHNKEVKLDHDLRDGDKTHAAVSLLREFEQNPQEALALIKREMKRHDQRGDRDKLHLGIQNNGDVIVWDKGERSGYFAGSIPAELRDQVMPAKPAAEAPALPDVQTNAQLPADTQAPIPAADAAQPAVPAAPEAQREIPPPPEHKEGPQSYEYEQPHQKFHIPCPIDIGVRNGSFHLGVNIFGLVKGGVSLGERNRGYVGSDVLKSEVSAGVDLNKEHIGPAGDWHIAGDNVTAGSARVGITPMPDGIRIGAGVDASAIGRHVGAGGHGGLEMGNQFGPDAGAYAHVGPAEAAASGYAKLSDQGLQAGTTTDVGAQPLVGVHSQTRVGLGSKNEAHADVGANLGDNGASAGAGIYPQLHPDVYIRGYSQERAGGAGLNPPRAWSEYYEAVGWDPEKH